MTQPPDDPRRYGDPGYGPGQVPGGNDGGSSTRKFDEPPPTSAYGDPGYQEPYLAPPYNEEYRGQYGQTHHEPQSYGEPQGYGDPQGYGQQPVAGQGAPGGGRPGGSRGRTIVLVALVAVALVVIGVVTALALTGGSDDDPGDTTAAASSTTTTRTTTSRRTPTSTTERSTTTTSEAPETTTTTRTAPSGVTYQITGRGEVVGLNYVDRGRVAIVAATSAPWSQRVEISDGGQARLTAVVIRGPLTCTIMFDGETLATQTSNGGLLTCAASLPSGG